VLTLTFEANMVSGGKGEYEALLLPLVHTRNTIDRILGSIARIDDGITPVRDTVANRRLTSCMIIWPAGSPQSMDGDLTGETNQIPFHPQVRTARIVRQDRRQFRVYDGGLGKNPTEKF
jgi:hypothetical protein